MGEGPSPLHTQAFEKRAQITGDVGASCENLISGQGAQASPESLWAVSTSQKADIARASVSSSEENPGAEGA